MGRMGKTKEMYVYLLATVDLSRLLGRLLTPVLLTSSVKKITPIITGVIRANKVSIYTGYHVRPVTND